MVEGLEWWDMVDGGGGESEIGVPVTARHGVATIFPRICDASHRYVLPLFQILYVIQ